MTVTISDQGKLILEACEKKIELQNKSEALALRSKALILELKAISDEQYGLLQNMADLDLKIDYLAKRL